MSAPHREKRDELVLVDPSVLLTDRGEAWVSDGDVRERIIISQSFSDLVFGGSGDRLYSPFLHDDDPDGFGERIGRLQSLLDGVATFRGSEYLDQLTGPSRAVFETLLQIHSDGSIFADEFAYLMTNSWMVSALRHTAEAFNSAGAVVIRIGKRIGARVTDQMIDPRDRPRLIADGSINRRAGIKWVVNMVWGGGAVAAGALILPIGILMGAASPILIPIFQEIDP